MPRRMATVFKKVATHSRQMATDEGKMATDFTYLRLSPLKAEPDAWGVAIFTISQAENHLIVTLMT